MDWYRLLKTKLAAIDHPTLREERVPEEIPPGGKVTTKRKRTLFRKQPGEGKISPGKKHPSLFRSNKEQA